MINNSDINQVLTRLSRQIQDQVTNGPQTEFLVARNIPNIFCCGQFFNESASKQRGLHGTAGAIRIIGDNPEVDPERVPELINGLIAYIKNRFQIEFEIRDYDAGNLKSEDVNTIKIAEKLTALNCISHDSPEKNELRTSIINLLVEKLEENGWGYDLTNNNPKVLPTIFVLKALHGNVSVQTLRRPLDWLIDELKRTNPDSEISEFYIKVLALDLFTFYWEDEVTHKELRKIFNSIWKQTKELFGQNIEQNIEYEINSNHSYIRIPWQLYIIALSAKLNIWTYSGQTIQRKLKGIKLSVLNGGFKYAHSGPGLSVRTNAILYENLQKVKKQQSNDSLIKFLFFLNKLTSIVTGKWSKLTIRLLALIFILLALLSNFIELGFGDSIFKDTKNDIIAGLIFSLSFNRR